MSFLCWDRTALQLSAAVSVLDGGPQPNSAGLPKFAVDDQFVVVNELKALNESSGALPGVITGISENFITVATESGDVALLQLSTIDGLPVSIADLTKKFALHIGYRLPSMTPSMRQRLVTLGALLSQNEWFWVTRLSKYRPIDLPLVVQEQWPWERINTQGVSIPIPPSIELWAAHQQPTWRLDVFYVSLIVAFLARLGRVTFFDVGFRVEKVLESTFGLEGYFAPYVPLRVELDPHWDIVRIYNAIQGQVDLTQTHLTYARDVLIRSSILRGMEELPGKRSWPVAVEIVEGSRTRSSQDNALDAEFTFSIVKNQDGIHKLVGYPGSGLGLVFADVGLRLFTTFLHGLTADSGQPLANVPIVGEVEQYQMLVQWNETYTDYPRDSYLAELFASQVARTPDAIAAVCDNLALSYAELDRRADRMAQGLRAQGVGPETVVGLFLERGLEFLIVMLGVFKAGAAYLPLDMRDPLERLTQVIEQSEVRLVLADQKGMPILKQACQELRAEQASIVLDIEALSQERSREFTACTPHDLAYVIYTSGSTGHPKGVMIEQWSMVNHLFAKVRDLALTEADRVAQVAAPCFDISVWQFLAPLVVGASVLILCDPIAHDPELLLEQVAIDRITILEVVPSLLGAILDTADRLESNPSAVGSLRWLISTGETLPPDLPRRWLDHFPTVPLLNAYGPTECSDDVAHHPIYQASPTDLVHIPIGRPIANTRLYVLNPNQQPQPVGVVGELYVGGEGVGRGYLKDPGQTAEAFVPDPFSNQPGRRLYRTGDLARYRPEGVIEFLGRCDHQVKVRGHRVELGEVEATLLRHPAVRAVVVMVREDNPGEKRLVAYLTANSEPPPMLTELSRFAKQNLPDSMVPSAFVLLRALPVNQNGKVDRRALLKITALKQAEEKIYFPPRTKTEVSLVQVWAEILGVERVSIYDNFFELGGHSISAIKVISLVRKMFNATLPIRSLYEMPVLAELAASIDRQQGSVDQKPS